MSANGQNAKHFAGRISGRINGQDAEQNSGHCAKQNGERINGLNSGQNTELDNKRNGEQNNERIATRSAYLRQDGRSS